MSEVSDLAAALVSAVQGHATEASVGALAAAIAAVLETTATPDEAQLLGRLAISTIESAMRSATRPMG